MSDGEAAPQLSANELFENNLKKTLFGAAPQIDKYSVASMLLLERIVSALPPQLAQELVNALTTEYPDREFVEQVEYHPGYFRALKVHLGYHSKIARYQKATRDAAMIPFERKREGVMTEILREGQPKQDESSWFRKILGVKDEE